MARKHIFERDPAEVAAALARADGDLKTGLASLDSGPDWTVRRCGCNGTFKEQLVQRPDGHRYFEPVSCRCKPDCLYHAHQALENQGDRRRE
jgi:hypothetical protein